MAIDTEYELGDTVYLITDERQRKRIVTMIQVNPSGIVYGLSCGEVDTKHYECEIVPDINIDYL